ncbi:MAG: hypothetical protein NVS3B6_06690 [Pseudarthrobacter sp.]
MNKVSGAEGWGAGRRLRIIYPNVWVALRMTIGCEAGHVKGYPRALRAELGGRPGLQ